MPRIPEGNFRNEPSTRVESARPLTIQSNTQQLRNMGRAAAQVGEGLEKAQIRVDSLKGAKDAADNWKNNEVPVIEELFSQSEGGFLPNGQKLQDAVTERVNKFNTKQMAVASKGNPEGGDMYKKYVFGDTEAMVRKAEVEASRQVESHTDGGLRSQGSLLQERLIDGAASTADVNRFRQSVLDSEPIIGREKANNILKGFEQSLASRAPQIVLNHPEGVTQQKIDEVKAIASKLPERFRRPALRNIDKAVKQRVELEHRRAIEANKKLASSVNTPLELGASQAKIGEAKKFFLNSPLGEYETPNERVGGYALLEGKVASVEIMASVGHLNQKDPEFLDTVNSRVEQAYRDIASSSMLEHASEDEIKAKLKAHLNANLASAMQERKKNPRDFQKKFFPSMEMQLNKNNPDTVVDSIISMQQGWGLPIDGIQLASREDAKKDGKLFKQWADGGDPTGKNVLNFVNQAGARFGAFSHKMLKDNINFGGADPSTLYMLDSDEKLRGDIAQGHGSFKDNIASLVSDTRITTETGQAVTATSGETRFIKQVKEAVGEKIPASSLSFGPGNAPKYEGYMKSVAYLAANKAVSLGTDISTAINEATKEMEEAFPSARDGVSSIMVPQKYAQNNNIEPSKLSGALKDAKRLVHIESLGYNIDIDSFSTEKILQNPTIGTKMKSIIGRGYDKSAQLREFKRVFSENVVVMNDPNNPDNIKFYLQDSKNGNIVPIPVMKDGKKKALTIPLDEYYHQRQVNLGSADVI